MMSVKHPASREAIWLIVGLTLAIFAACVAARTEGAPGAPVTANATAAVASAKASATANVPPATASATPNPPTSVAVAATDASPPVLFAAIMPDVDYWATPQPVVDRMLELARVKTSDVVYDLGCGDARSLVTAAQRYGASGIGFDIDPRLVAEARENVRRNGVENLVQIEQADIFTLISRPQTLFSYISLPGSTCGSSPSSRNYVQDRGSSRTNLRYPALGRRGSCRCGVRPTDLPIRTSRSRQRCTRSTYGKCHGKSSRQTGRQISVLSERLTPYSPVPHRVVGMQSVVWFAGNCGNIPLFSLRLRGKLHRI